jgi:U3 small nucleolar RNA-associated protein 15
VSLLEELWLRDGLEQALSGREEEKLVPVLRFLLKHVSDPRLNTVCIHVMDLVIGKPLPFFSVSP